MELPFKYDSLNTEVLYWMNLHDNGFVGLGADVLNMEIHLQGDQKKVTYQ